MKTQAYLLLIPVVIIISCSKKSQTKQPPVKPAGPTVTVSTFTGSGSVGATNGKGINASFNNPCGIAIDQSGNLYVVDKGNRLIRKIMPDGTVSTFVILSDAGAEAVAVDAAGNVYVADELSQTIQKYTSAGVSIATANCNSVYKFGAPAGLAVDAAENVFVISAGNTILIKVSFTSGVSAFVNGPPLNGANANMTIDASGNLYIACKGNNFIQQVSAAGQVSTYAGINNPLNTTSNDGPKSGATFVAPSGITIDAAGNIYVTQLHDNLIRKISVADSVSTIAGNGQAGSVNGSASNASFNNPSAIAVDVSGNLYVADSGNNLIRKITIN